MNKIEYLLTCLSEEAGEVSQAVGKALRFGLDEVGPYEYSKGLSNFERLQNEVHDIIAVYEMLCEARGGGTFVWHSAKVPDKQERVLKYAKYSRELGTLEEDLL